MRNALAASLAALAASVALAGAPAPDRGAVAIIVNPRNHAPDPSLEELRGALMLARQFWPDGHRIVLFLPPADSPARAVLLDRVYGMSDFQLRKYWVGELFRGAIPSIPSTLHGTDALAAAVAESEGGMSAVPASDVPPTVRVLRIGGRAPGEAGYPLVADR